MKFQAVVIGATGLVGSHLVHALMNDENCKSIRILVRRKTALHHAKVIEQVINFDHKEDYATYIKGDVLFSCLGSTRAQAGSIKNHYRVDYTYQYWAAQSAAQNGVNHYVLVSSPFAKIDSKNYYRKMKAELEAAVTQLDFQNITLIKPNGILGKRKGNRKWENIAGKFFTPIIKGIPPLRKYVPIHAKYIAATMLNAYYQSLTNTKRVTILSRDQVNPKS